MSRGKRFKKGLIFGAFDVPHYGHINLIRQAKDQCQTLVVYVSDDYLVKKRKGDFPLMKTGERMVIVENIKNVDGIGMESATLTKEDAIIKEKPDVLFAGDDMSPKNYPAIDLGIPVVFLPNTEGKSSEQIKKRLEKRIKNELEITVK